MEVFVARQPIFDRHQETVAYELLYRNNEINIFPNIDGDQATADVIINSYLNIGLESLSAGKPCFINFTENLLKLRVPTYFNPREIVVEILESVTPNSEVVQVCHELKALGYKIALDDFIFNESNPYDRELMKLADYVKVDFLNTTEAERGSIEVLSNVLGYRLLAEKVETMSHYEEAMEKGYHFFQGYFFSKPKIIATHDVPTYFHSYYSIIQSLEMTEPSIDKISQLIEQDLSLSYKLLKLINSPAYRPKHKIHSIRQAIVLLGLLEIKRWIYVLAVREQVGKRRQLENEVVTLCLTRAKMCELLADKHERSSMKSSYFLTGMFSLMETILSMPIDRILKDLPLNDDICNALTGSRNDLKQILELVVSVEKADWAMTEIIMENLKFNKREVMESYHHSCKWTEELLTQEVSELK
ncbi:HDOD domain-containing protein [Rossellomorea aquimaris]|uniref:EAL and HDOD domain-containing protein n=1 Tax=Rossellomorea aquimaris TaxID=189382 RepID=UPI001CD577E9|nr:HDOD domain-containing protein [Rossellomorea aquimaris]MCA1058498.1 HDOD domain-containing protein [Rossellomorea aquimaris]